MGRIYWIQRCSLNRMEKHTFNGKNKLRKNFENGFNE